MKKLMFVVMLIMSGFLIESSACTNFLITKGATVDGSTMISYAADSYLLYGELYHFPAAIYPDNSWVDIYEWDTGRYLGKIKQVRETYSVIGNMNEFQVAIGETTFGGRSELINDKGILDYGSLIYITLQRAKTAREAIKIMGELVAEYGYCSSGESFSISDPYEVWIMEMVGKGPDIKGAVWAAQRIPDGYVSAHANHSRIRNFPLNDPDNCIYAPDVISFSREKGFFTGKDTEFDFSEVYGAADYGSIRFCDARVWSFFRRINSSMEKYLSYILGESDERMPLWIKPDKKLSMHDVMELMRDHYEGTPLDMTKGVVAGPYGSPYRWRPLTWKHGSETYFHERPISTPQTGFSFITQSRSFLPDPIGGIIWFGVDDTYMTVYVPMYCSMKKVPRAFAVGVASFEKFSWESAFWIFNFVSNYCYSRYSLIIEDIKKVQHELEGSFLSEQNMIEANALTLYKQAPYSAVEFLNNYSIQQTEYVMDRWMRLGEFLIFKYLDGVVKDEFNKPKSPGYPEEWKRRMVEENGDFIKMRKLKSEIERQFLVAFEKAEELLNSKKYNEAKNKYEEALRLKPEDERVKIRMTQLESVIDEIEKAHHKYIK